MIIKANGEVLDYDGDLVIEKQAKLFKDLGVVAGDYSYSDILPGTNKNRKALGLETSNQDKIIYANVPSEILTDAGEPVYYGALRIDSIVKGDINFTFISGNSQWINLLGSDPILNNTTNLNLTQYEIDTDFPFTTTEPNYIIARMGKTDGIVFPLTDTGTLSTRGYRRLRPKDFQPFIYLKDVMAAIFNQCGMKLQGPLLNDYLYFNAIISGNNSTVTQKQIDNRRVYAGIAIAQSFTVVTTLNLAVGFANSTFPNRIYTNSKNANFNSTAHSYTVDVRQNLFIHGEIRCSAVAGDTLTVYIYVNGVNVNGILFAISVTNLSISTNIAVEKGDVVTVKIERTGGAAAISVTEVDLYFEPFAIYHIYPASLIRSMQFSDFVGEIFRMFNVVPSYNSYNKTVTAELFKNIKTNDPIDISPYIESIDQNFSDEVSNYGKTSYLKFSQSSTDDVTAYNKQNTLPYGAGKIDINNFYLDRNKDFISLGVFTAPFTYFNPAFGCWFPKLKYTKLVQYNSITTTAGVPAVDVQPYPITSTTNNPQAPGTALFHSSDPSANFEANGAFITRAVMGYPSYSFDWPGYNSPTGIDPFGPCIDALFIGDSKGTYQHMDHAQDSDEMVILTYLPAQQVSSFSNFDGVYFGVFGSAGTLQSYYTIFDFAYFLPPPNMSLQLTHAFGLPNGFTGIDATENYYRETGEILNDPVKYTAIAYLPEFIFKQLDPTIPVRIKTTEHNSLCYQNRITGYKGSDVPCEIELMKF